MKMNKILTERDDRRFAERKRDMCRALLGFLSEIREAKWLAEEKARKALSDKEEYRWIIKMADAVEDDYEFLIFHTEDEGMKEIDRIEERMVKGVREFKERSNS